MKKSKRNKLLKPTKTKVIVVVVALLLLAAGVRALTEGSSTQPNNTPTGSSSQTPNGAEPNLNPPTAEEKQDTEAHKDSLVQQQASNGNQTSSSVTPIITSANADGVYGFINGVFENGGTCTFSFTKNSESFTRTTAGFKNATSTNCTPLTLSSSDFPSTGTWNVVLSYSSATVAKVSSQPAKIQL